ncbi:MAG: hypothetical protein SFX74_07570 [Fimbriimonadaceae bacterium]|nr:hypothetical protein [Fimbriimonadaceae bacterium]
MRRDWMFVTVLLAAGHLMLPVVASAQAASSQRANVADERITLVGSYELGDLLDQIAAEGFGVTLHGKAFKLDDRLYFSATKVTRRQAVELLAATLGARLTVLHGVHVITSGPATFSDAFGAIPSGTIVTSEKGSATMVPGTLVHGTPGEDGSVTSQLRGTVVMTDPRGQRLATTTRPVGTVMRGTSSVTTENFGPRAKPRTVENARFIRSISKVQWTYAERYGVLPLQKLSEKQRNILGKVASYPVRITGGGRVILIDRRN